MSIPITHMPSEELMEVCDVKPERAITLQLTAIGNDCDNRPFMHVVFEHREPILFQKIEEIIRNWKVFPQTIRLKRLPGRRCVHQVEPYYVTRIDPITGNRERVMTKRYNKFAHTMIDVPVTMNTVSFFLAGSQCNDVEANVQRARAIHATEPFRVKI